jgi:VanZ family protein
VVCFECKGISWKTILLPILMGILIELAQNYLTTCRSGELADGVANSIGVMLGNGLFWIYRKIRR